MRRRTAPRKSGHRRGVGWFSCSSCSTAFYGPSRKSHGEPEFFWKTLSRSLASASVNSGLLLTAWGLRRRSTVTLPRHADYTQLRTATVSYISWQENCHDGDGYCPAALHRRCRSGPRPRTRRRPRILGAPTSGQTSEAWSTGRTRRWKRTVARGGPLGASSAGHRGDAPSETGSTGPALLLDVEVQLRRRPDLHRSRTFCESARIRCTSGAQRGHLTSTLRRQHPADLSNVLCTNPASRLSADPTRRN